MQQQNGNDECKIFDTYISEDNPEIEKKVESTEQKVDSESINKIEDYTEIIPQKIENKQKSTSKEEKILNLNNSNNKNGNIENNYDTQNLDFSFGKGLKQDNKTDENIKNITDLKTINNNNNNNNITNSNNNNITNSNNDNNNINNSNSKNNNDNNKDNNGKDINPKNGTNLSKSNINNNQNQNQNQNDIVEKREILSDNLSNRQLTDSISHFFDNNFEGNKKLKLIKEKFVYNFKNKERSESLEKALILFDKYSNYGKFKLNGSLNHSFTNRYDNPFKAYKIGNNSKMEEKNDKNEISYIKRKKYSVNNLEINCINNQNDNNDNKIIKKKIVNRKKVKKKSKEKEKENTNDNKLNLKNEKKNGFYIRKVIREEKYFIDKEGKEKLIGIKQSIFDSQNANPNSNMNGGGKMININKNNSFKNSQNKTLLNSKKISELIKGKIPNKKDLDYKGSFSLRNNISKNNIKNKNIELLGNKSLQKNINGDKCNNIKIVINKINKINSNPKINLNFIKKLRNKKNNNNQNNLSKNDNNGIKVENNNNIAFHLIKVDKCKNGNEPKKILTSNFHQYQNLIYNYSSNNVQKGGYIGKQKISDKLKIVKCEKFKDNKIMETNYISNNDIIKIPNNQRKILNKRNYSFKEVRNLSNNKKNDSKRILEKYNNNNKKYLTIDAYSHIDKNKYNKYKNSRNNSNTNIQNSFNKSNKNNHTFYESKSFSSKKKINQRFKNYNTYSEKDKIIKSYGNRNESISQMNSINLDENKNNVSHSVYYYQYAMNNFGTKRSDMNIINNNNIYNINTSFNTNIYSYNNAS